LKKWTLLALLLAFRPLLALEFEGSASDSSPKTASPNGGAESSLPRLLDAGDVPTAYTLLKNEVRVDERFFPGGGLLSKVSIGVFSRLMLGGALDLPGLVAAGPVTLQREDASLLVRLLALPEDAQLPAVSLGWDGPAYGPAELRGLYLSASKEFGTPLGYFQLHGGLNTSNVDNGWTASHDLRGSAAVTSSFRQVTGFFEADEIGHPAGPRLDGGLRVFFDPISLGLEFHDIGATRNGTPSWRVLRASYTGLF
jgi:hypothetical protein